MKLTVTIKGELEDYVLEQVKKTGKSNAMTVVDLAFQGMEYKQGLKSMAVFAAAIEDEQKKKAVLANVANVEVQA